MKDVHKLTDDALVELYANGNNEAFDILLNRYQSKLYSYIFYTVKDEDVANDLFQETFVKVILRIQSRRYVAAGRFAAWINRIAHNLIIDYFRQRENECLVSDEECGSDTLNNYQLLDDAYEVNLLNNQTMKDIKQLCKMLPEPQSRVLYLRYYCNMSFKEIAQELNISINTALGRMRYAILNIRRLATENNISLSLS